MDYQGRMTSEGESHCEAHRPIESLLKPKDLINIGNWNALQHLNQNHSIKLQEMQKTRPKTTKGKACQNPPWGWTLYCGAWSSSTKKKKTRWQYDRSIWIQKPENRRIHPQTGETLKTKHLPKNCFSTKRRLKFHRMILLKKKLDQSRTMLNKNLSVPLCAFINVDYKVTQRNLTGLKLRELMTATMLISPIKRHNRQQTL